jgi:hypothetical protein
MPNHVETITTIIGPIEVLDQIAALAADEKSILDHFLPLPSEATIKRTGVTPDGEPYEYSVFANGQDGGIDGYAAAVALWGSKWGDYDVWLVNDDRNAVRPSITIRNNSAWSPVVEGYRKMSEMLGIAVTLRYVDEGWCYVGAAAVADGRIVAENEFSDKALDAYAATKGVADRPSPDTDDDAQQEWWSDYSDAVEDAADFCDKQVTEALATALTAE